MKSRQEQDQELLEDIRKKAEQYPAASLIATQLSPSIIFLRNTPYSSELKESETYCRSEKHRLTKNTQFLYADKKKHLGMGLQAHLGNYQNIMQNFGDVYSPSEKRAKTSLGTSEVYDEILEYKKSMCLRIKSNTKKTKYIQIIYTNDYPCIMVYVQQNSVVKPKSVKTISEASHKAWVEFLISMFTGMINYYAYEKNIHIEMERRSSFGFLTPTICVTGESFRINTGLIPAVYADLVTDTLHELDKLIQELHECNIEVPSDIFYGNNDHEKYMCKKLAPIDNLTHLLFVPVETRSGLGVRNITRTSYARQGLSMIMFKELHAGRTTLEGFAQALYWAVQKITIVAKGTKNDGKEKHQKLVLSFNSNKQIQYGKAFKKDSSIDDIEFWVVVKKILENVSRTINKDKIASIKTKDVEAYKSLKRLYLQLKLRIEIIENENINVNELKNVYYNLEMLNEIIFAITAFESPFEIHDDGYGSDSECEEEVENKHLYAKKIITHNGMRAIWSALIAASKCFSENRVFMKTAYYEVEKGFKDLIKLHKINGITIVDSVSEANILIHDLNACVTDGVVKSDKIFSQENKVLILDVTSATTSLVRVHLQKFAESRAKVLFLVDSGFKNQQLGADKNQYGTVRIVTKSKKTTSEVYTNLLKEELPILSMTSHSYRRKMKEIGVVPTNRSYMHQP